MDTKDFTHKLLDRIKKDDIKQTPRYIFMLKNIVIWLFLVASILLWSLSLAISFDYLISADWYLFKRIGFIQVLQVFLPIFWVVSLVLSSLLSYYNYRHTNRGYKLSVLKVCSLNILLSFIVSFWLYLTGAASYIESQLETYAPTYRSMFVEDKTSRMLQVWQHEEAGLLIGEILEVGEDHFSFVDANDKHWNVLFNPSTMTEVKQRVQLVSWEKIKIIWEKVGDTDFQALEIRPFSWRREI